MRFLYPQEKERTIAELVFDLRRARKASGSRLTEGNRVVIVFESILVAAVVIFLPHDFGLTNPTISVVHLHWNLSTLLRCFSRDHSGLCAACHGCDDGEPGFGSSEENIAPNPCITLHCMSSTLAPKRGGASCVRFPGEGDWAQREED